MMVRLRSAFTLLEILVVLAILTFSMGLIMEITSVSARHSERVEEDTIVQLACENMMNAILAGDTGATVGVSTPIPDAPNWEMTVELVEGPIDKLLGVRITAQRYEIDEIPSLENPMQPIITRVPVAGRTYVIKEWARRSTIKTVVVHTDASGAQTVTEGTGETFENDLNAIANNLGGGLGEKSVDPFASIEQTFSNVNSSGVNQNEGNGLTSTRSGYSLGNNRSNVGNVGVSQNLNSDSASNSIPSNGTLTSVGEQRLGNN